MRKEQSSHLDQRSLVNNNPLLTKCKGHTGQYWPEVVTVRTSRCLVHTKMTEGQYSPVRLEQARLVSSLLYGTQLMPYILLQTHFRSVKCKGLPLHVMTQATQKEQTTTTLKKNILLSIFGTDADRLSLNSLICLTIS